MITCVSVAFSALLTVVAVLAGRGTLPPNRLIGICTPTVRASQAAWQAGHQAVVAYLAGQTALVAAAGAMVTGATLGGDPHPANGAGL